MTILYPLVQQVPREVELSAADFAELERVGRIRLSAELRQCLNDLAHFWAGQLHGRESPRPKQFRKRLKLIEKTLTDAYEALDLNREDALEWEHHLFNWARNSQAEGAEAFFKETDELLTLMKRMTALMHRIQGALPKDLGFPRPYEDKQYFITLADLFEHAGGTAAAYWSEYSDSGMAKTPFREFVQAFYKMLPAKLKRKPAGVDEALRAALRSRRSAGVTG